MWGKTETGLTKEGEPGTVALNITPSGLGTPVQTLREAEAKMGSESWEIYWRKACEGWKAAGRIDGKAGRPWSDSNLWKEGGKKNLERASESGQFWEISARLMGSVPAKVTSARNPASGRTGQQWWVTGRPEGRASAPVAPKSWHPRETLIWFLDFKKLLKEE